MLRSYFQSAADVLGYQFAGVVFGSFVQSGVFVVVYEKVVSYAAAYEYFFYAFYLPGFAEQVEQRSVIGVQVLADVGVYA